MSTLAQSVDQRRALDHYVVQIDDLAESGASYERLGFQVMPVMRHIELGSANRVIQLANTYLELIGDLDKSKAVVGDNLSARRQCGEGLSMVSLTSEDIESDHDTVVNLGLNPAPILNARRKVTMPDGSQDETNSVCFYIWRPERLYLSLFFSQHHKPHVIWVSDYQAHPNSAVDTVGMIWVSDDPAADKDYFSALYAATPESESDGRVVLRGSRGDTAEILSWQELKHRFPNTDIETCSRLAGYPIGLTITVEDPDKLRSILDANGVPHSRTGATTTVGPAETHGVVIEFVPVK